MVGRTRVSRPLACRWRSISASAVTAVFLVELVPIQLARAQDDPSSAETAAARTLAVDGLKLADAGRCAEAIDKLSRAQKLRHAPIVLGRLGECQIIQGKIVDGTENLRKVLREPLPPNPTPALLKARERAQAALDAAKPKIAFLTISLKGPQDVASATVTVDGQPVPAALLDAERPTDPGDHVIEASAAGFLKSSARVSVGPGDKQAIALRLDADPNFVAPAAAPPPGEAAAPSSHPAQSRGPAAPPARETRGPGGDGATISTGDVTPNRTAAYISWAVGGVALAVGAGFGFVAMKGKSELDKECVADRCPRSSESRLSEATSAGNIATVGFGVAAAGLALGTILYITASSSTSGGNDRSKLASTPSSPYVAFQPRVFVGVGQVGVAGTF